MISGIEIPPFLAICCKSLCRCQLCGGRCNDTALWQQFDYANGYNSRHLCRYCYEDLPRFNGLPNSRNLLTSPAISALFEKRQFDQLFAISPYVWPFTHWIPQFKYQQKFELANLFADLLCSMWLEKINECAKMPDDYVDDYAANNKKPDLVLAVPIHIQRWQERGFNQSHLIAKQFAQRLRYQYCDGFLVRIKHTEKQVGQSGNARRKRLKGAFALSENAIARMTRKKIDHVLLIDDVITTGATVNEISQLLKANGVDRVSIAAISIALPKEKGS